MGNSQKTGTNLGPEAEYMQLPELLLHPN